MFRIVFLNISDQILLEWQILIADRLHDRFGKLIGAVSVVMRAVTFLEQNA
jgi:hypothetical protein